jgi:hypothetical protein
MACHERVGTRVGGRGHDRDHDQGKQSEPVKARKHALNGRAGHLEALEHTESTEAAHMEAGKVVVDRSSVLVAVWDGQPARGLGGTADVVAYARERGVPVTVVWPEGATRG